MRVSCGHMFHENCIKTWLKRNRTCPMCRFKMNIKFKVQKDERRWICETDFHDQMHVTPDSDSRITTSIMKQ
ncbi:RING-H2 finger protein ATL32 [Acorus gramineus]|uniref:RING-H2 finger protein ATL32 n=1 Tax=Acorus gramineus TaxID=55184 RepID=A0AAV9BD77_ACOGR|nr:RING-H2 finger protein ATL32 [Acorus gramineus]